MNFMGLKEKVKIANIDSVMLTTKLNSDANLFRKETTISVFSYRILLSL